MPYHADADFRRTKLDADGHGHRQSQSACIHVRLHFMPLLGEVHIGLCSDKDARYMVERVLLLERRAARNENRCSAGGSFKLTRRLEIYEKEFVSLESYT